MLGLNHVSYLLPLTDPVILPWPAPRGGVGRNRYVPFIRPDPLTGGHQPSQERDHSIFIHGAIEALSQ